ncbi:MAG TPA: YeeE/YedE thiosulfate transporter family protein [Solirubrobacteraceae bacterium]|nr:YeeE/YedE thiosulfate transporter family protein [Solirubrobacteraceae bacterium]
MVHSQLPWFVGGPLLGLCVVAMRWLMNERLGVMGGWTDVVRTLAARRLSFGPFGWMLLGLIGGAAAYALVAGGPVFHGYGWLTATFTGAGGAVVVVAILLACGLLIGLGTKIAGGCTSGNGLSGNAMASPASLVATVTFFVTAIVVTFVTEALI